MEEGRRRIQNRCENLSERVSAGGAGGGRESPEDFRQSFEDARFQLEVVELAFAGYVDQPGIFELLDVVRECSGRDLQRGLGLRTAQRTVGFCDALEQLVAARIGERFEEAGAADPGETRRSGRRFRRIGDGAGHDQERWMQG